MGGGARFAFLLQCRCAGTIARHGSQQLGHDSRSVYRRATVLADGDLLAQPLRAALTGTTTSPGIFDVLVLLGRDESLARITDQATAAA